MIKNSKLKLCAVVVEAFLFAGSAVAATETDHGVDNQPQTLQNSKSFERFQKRVNQIANEHHVAVPSTQELLINNESKTDLLERAKTGPKIERIVDMGISKVRAVKGTDGKMLFIADNGRYVFTGKVFDLWQKKPLNSIEEISDAVRRIDLQSLNIKPEELNLARIGQGKKRVTIFVDPLCGWCHKLMNEVAQDDSLKHEYTFDFLVVAALGDGSAQLARRLHCAEPDPRKRFDLLAKGAEEIQALKQQESCTTDALQRTAFASQFLGVKAVPFVIAPDGRFARGKPADLRQFLEGNASDGGHDEAKPSSTK